MAINRTEQNWPDEVTHEVRAEEPFMNYREMAAYEGGLAVEMINRPPHGMDGWQKRIPKHVQQQSIKMHATLAAHFYNLSR